MAPTAPLTVLYGIAFLKKFIGGKKKQIRKPWLSAILTVGVKTKDKMYNDFNEAAWPSLENRI